MPGARNQKRLAADLMKCGVNRVWIDPSMLEDVESAITRGDVRSMISSGAIQKKQKIGISKSRKNYLKAQRAKGRRSGSGSRKGAKNARTSRKETWMKTIRGIRARLKELRTSGAIDSKTYRKVYRQAKGGTFKSKSHLNTQLRISGVLKEKEVEK